MKNKLKRILYVGYYLYKMNRSLFWKFLNFTSRETGKSKLYLIVASINDSILFNVSLLEYFQFRFFEKNQLDKSNWAGTGFMYEYQLAMNPKNVRSILQDKILFLNTYKDFVSHTHLTLNELKKDEQKGAFLLQENTKVVLKNSNGQCGIGIVILNTNELTPYALIHRLVKNRHKDKNLSTLNQKSTKYTLPPCLFRLDMPKVFVYYNFRFKGKCYSDIFDV